MSDDHMAAAAGKRGSAPLAGDNTVRSREGALLLGLLLDVSLFFPYLAAAMWANSLTLIGEAARGGLLILLELYLFLLLRRIHRGRTAEYEFGTGNLEQFGNLAVGVAMIAAALSMLAGIAARWAVPPEQASGGLLLGILMAVVNLGFNLAALASVWRAGRDGTSIILSGQIRARLSKTISSAVVVLVTLVNAVGAGDAVGRVADLIGAAFVVCVMVALGVELCRKAMPSLIEQTLGEARQQSINQVLARHFDRFDALGAVRSRQTGGGALVELQLGFAGSRSMAEVQQAADVVAAEIAALIQGAEVVVVPYAIGPRGAPLAAGD